MSYTVPKLTQRGNHSHYHSQKSLALQARAITYIDDITNVCVDAINMNSQALATAVSHCSVANETSHDDKKDEVKLTVIV